MENLIKELRTKLLDTECASNVYPDEFLIPFLKSYDLDVDLACQLVVKYWNGRVDYPRVFTQLKSGFRALFEDNLLTIYDKHDLPNRNEGDEELTVIVCRPGMWNPNKTSFEELINVAVYLAEYLTLVKKCNGGKIIVVHDMKGLGFSQISHIRPWAVFPLFELTQHYLPIKFDKILVVNNNYVTSTGYNLVKPLMASYMKEKMIFLGSDLDQLDKHGIPRNLVENFDNSKVYEDIVANDDNLGIRWKTYMKTPDNRERRGSYFFN